MPVVQVGRHLRDAESLCLLHGRQLVMMSDHHRLAVTGADQRPGDHAVEPPIGGRAVVRMQLRVGLLHPQLIELLRRELATPDPRVGVVAAELMVDPLGAAVDQRGAVRVAVFASSGAIGCLTGRIGIGATQGRVWRAGSDFNRRGEVVDRRRLCEGAGAQAALEGQAATRRPTDDGAGEVEPVKMVRRASWSSGSGRSGSGEPGIGAFDDHAVPWPGVALCPAFLAAASQVQGEGEFLSQSARLVVVEAFVKAQVLGMLLGGGRAFHRDRFQGLPHQLVVVAVGAVDHLSERHAVAIGQHRVLDATFASIGGIAPGFSPPSGALPIVLPAPATSTRCLAGRRRPGSLPARCREHARSHPLLKAPVRRGGRTNPVLRSAFH